MKIRLAHENRKREATTSWKKKTSREKKGKFISKKLEDIQKRGRFPSLKVPRGRGKKKKGFADEFQGKKGSISREKERKKKRVLLHGVPGKKRSGTLIPGGGGRGTCRRKTILGRENLCCLPYQRKGLAHRSARKREMIFTNDWGEGVHDLLPGLRERGHCASDGKRGEVLPS